MITLHFNMKKLIVSSISTALTLILITSCGNKTNNNVLPPNIIDQQKEVGITGVYPSAYKSLGNLAKENSSDSKNHIVEIDNSLKYKLRNNKEISYYAFTLSVKYPSLNDLEFIYKDKNVLEVKPPNIKEKEFMETEALKNTGDSRLPALYSIDLLTKLIDKKILVWESEKLSSNESKFTFIALAEEIVAPKDTKRFKLEVKFKSNAKFQDWIEPVRSPIHLAVIGDSVMWGQGIAEENKLHNLVKKILEKEKNQTVRFYNYANSGSKFGDPNDNSYEEWNGEIPRGTPTINAQLKKILEKYKPIDNGEQVSEIISPNRLDLLLMDGGINNVVSSRILLGLNPKKLIVDPSEIKAIEGVSDVEEGSIKSTVDKIKNIMNVNDPDNKALRKDINESYCYNEDRNDFSLCENNNNVEKLLEVARTKLPNAQISYFGYFPLIAENSKLKCEVPVNIKNVATGKEIKINFGLNGLFGMVTFWGLEPLIGTNPASILSGALSIGGTPLSEFVRKGAIRRSNFWVMHSNRIINRAVESVTQKNQFHGRGTLRFVPIAHKFKDKTILTPDSYLWGIKGAKCQDGEDLFPAEDEVKDKRRELCQSMIDEGFNNFYCPRVSLFHPNNKGFENGYLPELLSYLRNSGLLSRNDI